MYKVKYAVNYFNRNEELEYLYISVKESFFDGKSRYPLRPRFTQPVDPISAFTSLTCVLKKYNCFTGPETGIILEMNDKYIRDSEKNAAVRQLVSEQLEDYRKHDREENRKQLNSLLELISVHLDNLPFEEDDFLFYDRIIDTWYDDDSYSGYLKKEIRKFTSISLTHEIIGRTEESDTPYS